MKRNKFFLLCTVVALYSVQLAAQDDLYYDPSRQTGSTTTEYTRATEDNQREPGNYTGVYDDENYDYDDENSYEYSSRIRRFHRERDLGWGYYDPFFTDAWLYDPWFNPGASIYVMAYNDYWSWRRWNRYNRWNRWNSWNAGPSWGWGYNNWCPWNSYNSFNTWNSWNNFYVFNNYYYDPYWSWNGYNPYYCPNNVFIQNNYYDNNGGWNNGGGGNPTNTYVGPRRGGTTVNPGGRAIAEPKTGRVIKSDIEPNYERKSDKTNGRINDDVERQQIPATNPTTGTPANPKPRVDDVQSAPSKSPKTNRGDDVQSAPTKAPKVNRGEDVQSAPAPRIERDPIKANDNPTPVRKQRDEVAPQQPPVRKEREGIKREEEPIRPIRTDRDTRNDRDPVRNAPEPTRQSTKRAKEDDRSFNPDRTERTMQRTESRDERRMERSERPARTEERPARIERSEPRMERAPRQESRQESRPSRSESAPSRSNDSRKSGGGRGN